MTKKERAPKKEKPTKRDNEFLRKSDAERRENRKSNAITAIVVIVIVLLLIGISTVVGLVVKDNPSDSSDEFGTNANHTWVWRWNLIDNYDNTVLYLTQQGYISGSDFEAEYDADKAEANNGLIGTIKMTDDRGFFEIYYFGKTETEKETTNAKAYFDGDLKNRKNSDGTLNVECRGRVCYVYQGDIFDKGVFK